MKTSISTQTRTQTPNNQDMRRNCCALRYSIRTLCAVVAVAALIAALFVRFHRDENARQLAERIDFYRRIVAEQSGVNGPPLLRIVSADDGSPVCHVIVGLTLIGPDGGDGGWKPFLTDANGYARQHIPLRSGRYQWHLIPSVESQYDRHYWEPRMPYVVVASDDTTTVPTFCLHTRADSRQRF